MSSKELNQICAFSLHPVQITTKLILKVNFKFSSIIYWSVINKRKLVEIWKISGLLFHYLPKKNQPGKSKTDSRLQDC